MNEGESERRNRLIGLKLRALVRDHLDDPTVGEASAIGVGAALVHRGTAWVLLDDRPERRLGAAIAWAMRAGVSSLEVIAETGVGTLTRRAAEFEPVIGVWTTADRLLVPGRPDPLPTPTPPPDHHLTFLELIIAGGATPNTEHGVLFGEVRGLEVCRVVDDAAMDVTRLEVGLGAHDREAFQMMHGDVPTVDSLTRIVEAVQGHRRVDSSPHPLNRIAVERFLRWRVEQDPQLIGATVVAPAPPPMPRSNLKDPVPCVAWGSTASDEHLTVVFCSGVDLDLIPDAADARLAAVAADPDRAQGTRLVVVLPARDRLPLTGQIADRLRHSVEFVSLD